ncbi:MAG: hypothetical protein K0V04_05250 [Deltaproteobacteria bacterium]|nr:hypothetical protein [Deltaproteobacteria bacterium]
MLPLPEAIAIAAIAAAAHDIRQRMRLNCALAPLGSSPTCAYPLLATWFIRE